MSELASFLKIEGNKIYLANNNVHYIMAAKCWVNDPLHFKMSALLVLNLFYVAAIIIYQNHLSLMEN